MPASPDSPPPAGDLPPGYQPMTAGGEYMKINGPLHVRREGARVWIGFRVEPRHCNPMGILHGGMMATFCDMLLPISAHYLSADLARRMLPTIQLQVDYLGPSPLGAWVQGDAQLLRTTRSLVFLQGLVSADGATVARASGIFKIGALFDDSADFGQARLRTAKRPPQESED